LTAEDIGGDDLPDGDDPQVVSFSALAFLLALLALGLLLMLAITAR
jgi:hypothetical protein